MATGLYSSPPWDLWVGFDDLFSCHNIARDSISESVNIDGLFGDTRKRFAYTEQATKHWLQNFALEAPCIQSV